MRPPGSPSPGEILALDPDMVVVDFDLAQRQPNGAKAPYTGVTLAAAIRDKVPSIPVLLVSRGALGRRLERRRDLPASFDDLIYKEQIAKAPPEVVKDLAELISGFQTLASIPKLRWTDLVTLLGARDADEREALRLSTGSSGSDASPAVWRVSEAARWLRNVVLAYPGILLDDLFSATLLGIGLESFWNLRLQAALASARYSGPFAGSPRWWKARLLALSAKRLTKANMAGPPQVFVDAWNATHKRDRLRRAKCVVSRTEVADAVCWVLRRPVKREYSLPYQPDGRPQIMDEARVSFKAIDEDERFREEAIPLVYRHLVEARQRGRRARK